MLQEAQQKKEEAARQKEEWILMNLRSMSTYEEQQDFLEFIAIPPTPPPSAPSDWQTDHVFHSATAIGRVVRCLASSFDDSIEGLH